MKNSAAKLTSLNRSTKGKLFDVRYKWLANYE